MAEEAVISGDSDDHTPENFADPGKSDVSIVFTSETNVQRRMEVLESEKKKLKRENHEMNERLKNLLSEIESLGGEELEMNQRLREMETEMEQSEEEKNALEAITARAVELETEVSRLENDLIAAMNAGDKAALGAAELKRVLADKGERVDIMEKEAEGLRKTRAENEKKMRELERKIGVLEVREMEEKSKKLRVEEEMRGNIDLKEREAGGFKKKVESLESEVVRNREELEKVRSEKKGLEEAVEGSEKKAVEMVVELEKKVVEAERVISGLKEKIINGIPVVEEKGFLGHKSSWPVVTAGSIGAVGLAAVILFVCYSRQR